MQTTKTAIAATLLVLAGQAMAVDNDHGRNLASACSPCHGTNGHSAGITESLAGMPMDEFTKKLKDFKTGAKPATVMHRLANAYTDEQAALMGAYFATQKK